MKMGTIASPCRYDVTARRPIQSPMPRSPSILPCASSRERLSGLGSATHTPQAFDPMFFGMPRSDDRLILRDRIADA